MNMAPRAFSQAAASKLVWTLMLLAGVQLSMFVGMVLSHPSRGGILNLGALGFVALVVTVALRPFVGWLVFSFTMVCLVCFAINPDRYLNLVDLLLLVLGPVVVLGSTRRETLAREALRTGPEHDALRLATRKFAVAGIAYYVLIIASLSLTYFNIGAKEALEIFFAIVRCIEGALIFPFGLWLIRKDRDIALSVRAMYVALALLVVVNLVQLNALQTYRAGMTWIVNEPTWSVEDANELASTMVLLWGLILIENHLKPRFTTYPLLALMLLLVFLSQSRSGLLALVVFMALSLRRLIRWQHVVGLAVVVPLVLKFVPVDAIERIVNSVTYKQGSFEVITMVIRYIGYKAAVEVFLDNWLFGVGYMSLRYVTVPYNPLGIVMLGAENFYLETAAGLGIIGIAVVTWWYVRLFQLGRLCKRMAPPGTRAEALAKMHVPMMIALSVPNLTGNTFMGLIGTGQLMLWCAFLIRSTHFAISSRDEQALSPASSHPSLVTQPSRSEPDA